MGVCPQFDILYDQLTVREHLELFATFKGVPGSEASNQIDKILKDVNLNNMQDI